MTQLLALDKPCKETLTLITQTLAWAGLDVRRSFDLRSALAQIPGSACPCHGSAPCDCEYIVLLVYAPNGRPVTLVVHGIDGHSWVVMPYRDSDAELRATIAQVLSPDSMAFQM